MDLHTKRTFTSLQMAIKWMSRPRHRLLLEAFSSAWSAKSWQSPSRRSQCSRISIDVHGDNKTCGEIMEMWFAERSRQIEKTTASKYSAGIDRLSRLPIYDTPVKKLSKSSLLDLIDDLMDGAGGDRKMGCRSAKTYTEPLRMALSWAAAEGYIIRNPFQGVRLPKDEHREQKILLQKDVDDLIASARIHNPSFLIPLELALYGGLCREEIAGLTWQDVDMKSGAITIKRAAAKTWGSVERIEKRTKTGYRTRTVNLPGFVLDDLRAAPKLSEFVSATSTGKPYALDSYAQALRRLENRVNDERKGTPVAPMPLASFHDLRHTHAALCIALGIHMKAISERLGHASIKITMDLYGYLMPGAQQAVADAFDAARKSG